MVVLDPPRKGCEPKLLETVAAMAPERVVYVSCNPATLARDLKLPAEKGYAVTEVQPVDMFPHTSHIECVVFDGDSCYGIQAFQPLFSGRFELWWPAQPRAA